jgi:hypothetical protein
MRACPTPAGIVGQRYDRTRGQYWLRFIGEAAEEAEVYYQDGLELRYIF